VLQIYTPSFSLFAVLLEAPDRLRPRCLRPSMHDLTHVLTHEHLLIIDHIQQRFMSLGPFWLLYILPFAVKRRALNRVLVHSNSTILNVSHKQQTNAHGGERIGRLVWGSHSNS